LSPRLGEFDDGGWLDNFTSKCLCYFFGVIGVSPAALWLILGSWVAGRACACCRRRVVQV
jgi:hypothetical protein